MTCHLVMNIRKKGAALLLSLLMLLALLSAGHADAAVPEQSLTDYAENIQAALYGSEDGAALPQYVADGPLLVSFLR